MAIQSEPVVIVIYNALGELIRQVQIRNNAPYITIDLSDQVNGLYLIQLHGHNEKGQQKLIIQK